MSIKVLMVDVDGVIVRDPNGRRWDADIERDLAIKPNDLQSLFFARHWPEIERGRADLRDRLTEALPTFAPHVTPQAFIDYWFARDAALDHVLLADLAALRASGMRVHLATVQEHYRAHHLWDVLDLKSRFDAMHYAAALGATKREAAFFAAAEARAGAAPAEIGLIDDNTDCIDAAREAGWRGFVWRPGATLKEALAAMGRN